MTLEPQDQDQGGASAEPAAAPAVGVFAAGVLILALALLILLPFATTGQPAGKSWFLSPRNAPLAAILVMALGAGLLVAQFVRAWLGAKDRRAYLFEAFEGFEGSAEALVYSIMFGLYVVGLGYLGFAVSTLTFGQACLWYAGLRSLRWSLWNALFTLVLVVILRGAMGLWFPQAPILEFMPSWFANTIGPYL